MSATFHEDARGTIRLPHCVVDLDRRRILGADGSARLTTREAQLLGYLAANEGRPVSQDELLLEVWGRHPGSGSRGTLYTVVQRVRAKVEPDPSHPQHVMTVHGEGYRFERGAPADRSFAADHHHALPTDVAPFVGRQVELAALADRVVETRLLTLVGPPGIGKTRLAVQLARQRPDSAWFIDLTACGSIEDVVQAFASALDLQGVPADASGAGRLARALDDEGSCTVVVDNFESVIEVAVPWLADLVGRTTRARFVVTSRQRLRVHGERLFVVPPLSDDDSRALLTARVGALSAELVVSGRSLAPLLASLQGLPLALELAAPLLEVVDPAVLSDRVEEHLSLLGPSWRDVPARHSSLRAAVASAWDALTPVERTTLARFSVFRGGFSAEAAEAVTGCDLATLRALCDKSMVRTIGLPGGGRRFDLFEAIRVFAAEHLPADSPAFGRHVDWFGGWVGPVAARVRDLGDPVARQELRREVPNLRAAHHVALMCDPERSIDVVIELQCLLRLTDPAGLLAMVRASLATEGLSAARRVRGSCIESGLLEDLGFYAEAPQPLEAARALAGADPALLAMVERLEARDHHRTHRWPACEASYGRALAFFERTGQQLEALRTRGYLASALLEQRRDRDVFDTLQPTIGVLESMGAEHECASLYDMLATAQLNLGAVDEALASLDRAIELAETFEQPILLPLAHAQLATAELHRGRSDAAVGHIERSQQLFGEFGYPRRATLCGSVVCLVRLARGDADLPLPILREAVRLARTLNNAIATFIVATAAAECFAWAGAVPEAEASLAWLREDGPTDHPVWISGRTLCEAHVALARDGEAAIPLVERTLSEDHPEAAEIRLSARRLSARLAVVRRGDPGRARP